MGKVSNADALKAIDTVTKAKFGTPTAKAAAVAEKAVKFVKAPTATGGTKAINIAGSVDVASYVYCAVSKTASRLRMLNATATKNTTVTTKAAEPVKEVVNLQSSSMATKYTIKRFEAKAGALAFTFLFDGLLEGKSYDWLCEATSLAPVNAAFRTPMSKGKTATSPAPKVEE